MENARTSIAADPQAGVARTGIAGLTGAEWIVVFVAVTVASLPAVMPAMVGAMATQPGVGTVGAGYLVSMNMAGIFAGTLLCVLAQGRAAPDRLIVTGLSVMILGNMVTIAVGSLPSLLAARALSGLGEGFAAGICYSLMAASRRPAITFSFYTAGQAVVGAVGMGLLPWLVALFDWRAFYIVMSVIAVPALLLARTATGGVAAPDRTVRGDVAPVSAPGWAMLAIVFVYFSGMALIWAFTQRIGELNGLSLATVSAALASSAVAGLAGSLAIGAGAHRLSDRTAWIIGMALVIVSAAGFWSSTPWLFFAAAWALNFAWGFQYPFLFRVLARSDPGRGAAILPMATGIALSVGPALGGLILQHAGLPAACGVFLILTLGALAACLFLGARAPSSIAEPEA
jgi:predicted MFS family arabinose efflux permease